MAQVLQHGSASPFDFLARCCHSTVLLQYIVLFNIFFTVSSGLKNRGVVSIVCDSSVGSVFAFSPGSWCLSL